MHPRKNGRALVLLRRRRGRSSLRPASRSSMRPARAARWRIVDDVRIGTRVIRAALRDRDRVLERLLGSDVQELVLHVECLAVRRKRLNHELTTGVVVDVARLEDPLRTRPVLSEDNRPHALHVLVFGIERELGGGRRREPYLDVWHLISGKREGWRRCDCWKSSLARTSNFTMPPATIPGERARANAAGGTRAEALRPRLAARHRCDPTQSAPSRAAQDGR